MGRGGDPLGGGAITFDFHDTLVRCDRWFELEVRTLPAAFLRWRAERRGDEADGEGEAAAGLAYRRLRERIVADGRELPAERCVAVVLEELGIAASAGEIAEGVEALMRAALPEARPLPGAAETVGALAAAGVPLGVVSSAVHHPFLEWALARFGLRAAFRNVTTSASAGWYKSRPEIYAVALGSLGSPAARSVHVGDSARWDVAGARRAGMAAVWLNGDGQAPPVEGDPAPDLTLTTLVGAAPALLGLLRDRERAA